ncbi:VanZ family protein [Spirosoma migulaei]
MYLSWVPDPELKHIWFIPKWIAGWSDTRAHENQRTGVPFVFLGICAGLLPTRKSRPLDGWALLWLILVGVVILAETGQLLIPERHFSWSDVMWGALGSLVGLVIAAFFTNLRGFRLSR